MKKLLFLLPLLVVRLSLAEKPAKMSPLESLKLGNLRFLTGEDITHDLSEQMEANKDKQSPETVVLTCMDSRSIPELTFNQGIGHMFNIGIAGNILNSDILGSLEYATKVIGSKLILVLGHTNCGAVKGACDQVDLGHIGPMVKKIYPAVKQARSKNPKGKCSDPKFIDEAARLNVKNVIAEIQKKSPIIASMIKAGKIKIQGAMYDIWTGKVNFEINH